MNKENTEMFFGDDEDVILTLTDEDGEDLEVQLLAGFEIEELKSEYLAAMPLGEDGEPTGEVFVLKYQEDQDGHPEISGIEDEEEGELATEALRQMLKSGMVEGFDCDEDGEDDEDDYLDDLGSIFPGISIDK